MTPVRTEPQPKLWSRSEYQRLAELDAFAPGERVELIEGIIVAKSSQNLAHTRSVSHATTLLVRLFGETHYVRVQCSLYLTELSEPEPDFALVAHALIDGPDVTDNPRWADLVIEVSDTSLKYDQNKKLAIYAEVGLPDYWIVNLSEQQLEVYRSPLGSGYTEIRKLALGETIAPLFAPTIEVPVQGLF